MEQRVAIVTGSTAGIGFVCARSLVGQGLHTVLAARDLDKAEASMAQIRAAHPEGSMSAVRLELGSLASVREAAGEVLERHGRLDVLVNNAGGAQGTRWETEDGFEATLAINHLGPYLFTRLLLARLLQAQAPRVVFTASEGHRVGPLDLDDLGLQKGWTTLGAYGRSKLMNLLTAQKLHALHGEQGLVASSMHPGGVRTGIWQKGGWQARIVGVLGYPFMRTPEQGADTLTWLATAPEAADAAGRYFIDRAPVRIAKHATPEARDQLWDRSAELVGLTV